MVSAVCLPRTAGYTIFKMNDDSQDRRGSGDKPVLVGPQPFSFEDILRHVDPAPEEETERFVAAIYADRLQAAEITSPE